MKRILLAVILLAATFSVKAWHYSYDKAVLLVVAQNLNPETLNLVKEYVGEDVTRASGHLAWHRKHDRYLHTAGWHTLHLDKNLQPVAMGEDDAYVQIERALEIIRSRQEHKVAEVKFAVHTVMNLICDMHNIGNVVIDGVPLSGTDFKVDTSSGTAGGRAATIKPYSWKMLWSYRYITYHGSSCYTPEMWAKDIVLMFRDKKAEFSNGTLKEWANDIGCYTKGVYDVLEANNGQFLHATIQAHEELHMSCLARAAYRIAALLNANLK